MPVADNKRADTLLQLMQYIEGFTLQRAWVDLSDEELFWEPVGGAWGVRRRSDCQTPTPFGEGEWVCDFDFDLMVAAIQGQAIEPMTTIGWLLWHIASQPGRLAELDFLGGARQADSGRTSPYLTHHQVFASAADAVGAMQAGWQALRRELSAAIDAQLEQPTRSWSYGRERPSDGLLAPGSEPGPETSGTGIIAGVLNEVSHRGTQICVLRDLYRARRS
jgi:hypothetical protein